MMGQDLDQAFRPYAEYVPAIRAFCERLIPIVREAAKTCGYAIGVHGSMERDLDLIAAPWVEEAVSYEALIIVIKEALQQALGTGNVYVRARPDEVGAHGRQWANFYFSGDVGVENNAGCHPFIDLSVMPRIPHVV
jgi:hypothetical protein